MQAGQEASITDDPKLVHIPWAPYRSLSVGWERDTTLSMVTNDIALELKLSLQEFWLWLRLESPGNFLEK